MGGVQGEAGAAPALALAAVVVRGKRSKRRRGGAIAAAGSSSAATEGSTSRSGADEAASGCVTEEEEDMALCLMLLASGGHGARPGSPAREADSAVAVVVAVADKEAKFRSRRPVDGAAGEFVYECKTCNKCFPSFQALGGHRTSHKKPRLVPPLPPTTPPEDNKLAVAETTTAVEKPPPPAQAATDPTVLAIPVIPKQEVVDTNATTIAIMSSSKQPRVHECSICGAEFSSGQALGGHMRRHRPLLPASASVSALDDGPRKEKSLLELDLNMPAPCEDGETSATSPAAFAFAVKERPPLLFPASASALVDCHY